MMSFGFALARDPLDLVIVEKLVLAPHAVGHDLEPLARHVDRRAVGQVPAGREVEAHEGVARAAAAPGTPPGSSGCRSSAARWRTSRRRASSPARSPASRRHRRTRSRRSSACPDSPRRICWSSPSPAPRARRATRCSPTRSARSRAAGGRARWRSPSAISGSDSASVAEKKASGPEGSRTGSVGDIRGPGSVGVCRAACCSAAG